VRTNEEVLDILEDGCDYVMNERWLSSEEIEYAPLREAWRRLEQLYDIYQSQIGLINGIIDRMRENA
jgi:hypothetical protein